MTYNYTFFVILVQLLVVNYFDFKYKVISNLWPIFNLIFFCSNLIYIGSFNLIGWDLFTIPVVFFVIGFVLFLFKIVGAGDVKYLSTLLLLIDQPTQIAFLTRLATITIIVGIISVLVTIYQNRKKLMAKEFRGIFGQRRNIYAPLILIAWIWLGFYNE